MTESKITLAFQSWNNIFNWYTPNGHPEDWIIDGKFTLPYSHGRHYFTEESIKDHADQIETLSIEELKKIGVVVDEDDYLFKNSNFEVQLSENISLGEKYIFPIIIHKIDYFYMQRKIGFRYISPRVIEDVKKNIAKIVLFFPFEGNTSIYPPDNRVSQRTDGMKILDKWCEELKFTKDQVFFIQPNMLSRMFNKDNELKNFTPPGVDTFINWTPGDNAKEVLPFEPIDNKYLFLSYNRRIRAHRLFLILKLLKSNLFNKGLISIGEQITPQKFDYQLAIFNSNELLPYIRQLESITPINLDMDLIENNPAIQITKDHYRKTFISIITETHFESGIIFRSEKIFKTIAVGHPFIVLPSPGFLKFLKMLGFETYSRWIDERYDNEKNLVTRISMIIKELKKFSNMDLEELKKIRNEMKSVAEYNLNLLKILQNDRSTFHSKSSIVTEFKKIWNGIKRIKASVIGLGKLGLPCAEVMSQYHDITGYDIDLKKVDQLIDVKSSIQDAIKDREIIFIAVPTPHDSQYDGSNPIANLPPKDFDYSIVENVLKEIVDHASDSQLIVLISTVLPGTIRTRFKSIIKNKRFVYNPFLIAMGSVKWDFENPECVIIGTETGDNNADSKLLSDFYRPILKNNPRFNVGTWDEAESIKIFYNTFISAKISLVNMIQDVAEKNGNINVDIVTDALKHATQRITGPKYLTAGMGDAGACHPRDNIALRYLAEKLDLGYDLFHEIMYSRDKQAENIAKKLIQLSKEYNLPIVINGKAYKPYVSYTEGSYSLLIGNYIEQHGFKVSYADPLTGDIWAGKAVILMAHNPYVTYTGTGTPITDNVFYFNVEPGSVVLDPWRFIKKSSDVTVIHYGNTRKLK